MSFLKKLLRLIFGRGKSAPAKPNSTKVGNDKWPVLTAMQGHIKFMSLAMHKGVLAAGTYSNGGPVAVHYGKAVRKFPAKESVHSLVSTPSHLIASFEKDSEVKDGVTGDRLAGGNKYMVTDTRELLGKFVSASTKSFRNSDGVYIKVHGKDIVRVSKGKWFCRQFFMDGDTANLLAFNYDKEEGGVFQSTDLKTWTWRPIFANYRPMRAVIHKGIPHISFSKYVNKTRLTAGVLTLEKDPISGLYSSYQIIDEDPTHKGAFDIVSFKGHIYYTTLNWKGSGNASVRTNQSGKFETLVEFDEPEALGLVATPWGNLYVGVGGNGRRGKVYEVGLKSLTPPPPKVQVLTSYTQIGDGFVWKPVSEGNGKLVVLLPEGHYGPKHIFVGGERSAPIRLTNGGRPTYYLGKKGADYPKDVLLQIGEEKFIIPNPAQRIAKPK